MIKSDTMEDKLQEFLAEILKNMGVAFRKFRVSTEENPSGGKLYRIDIDSDETALLIGYHGETIYALQHLLKSLAWKKTGENVFLVLDVDGYRKRQEDNVIALAKKKAEALRRTASDQILPPMSPYLRRVVHMALAKPEYSDITTESMGEGEDRAVTLKLKQ